MNPRHRLAIATAPRRNSLHWTQGETTWEEVKGWLESPADKKEAGNYVFGTLRPTTVTHPKRTSPCTDLHRRKDAIETRCAITLDVDHPEPMFVELLELTLPYAAIMHTTYSSAPGEERYRIIIPVDRPLIPDEYHAAATVLMRQLGETQFDPGSAEPERYMFMPSTQQPQWFQSWAWDGPLAPATELLAGWEWDLRDQPFPSASRFKRSPFELDGTVGAFNRAYRDWDELIEEFELPYERADATRWHLVGSRSVAGMGELAPDSGLVYSHHAGDPAFGRACSAFDLVRAHKFGELDEGVSKQTPVNRLPSHVAMLDLAAVDHRVTAELVGQDFSKDMDATAAALVWQRDLRRNRAGTSVLDVIQNWDLLREHDPVLATLCFNTLSGTVEMDPLPSWRGERDADPAVRATDRARIAQYLEREYGLKTSRFVVDEHIHTTADNRRFNPVVDYLLALEWDRVPRLETCLPGVQPTPYTRMVARKVMVAAVARMLNPGCKWDHTLVLYGDEGLGKSYWVEKLARGYSANLGAISNKDTLLALQRSWIMVSDEGHSLRKADSDEQKEFLTRTHDVFRLPYERETTSHPRHSVIWSTTNDQVFLRRQEGNRRFLIVHCEEQVDFAQLTDAYVDQLWAEAVALYRAGETLFLPTEDAMMAAAERTRYTEEDALEGLIREYVDVLKPEDWDSKSMEGRQMWLRDRADGVLPEGTVETEYLCSAQVWVEILGRRLGDHRRGDLLEIGATLQRMGWIPETQSRRVPVYGPQKVFRKNTFLE